jgi:hypothetical protein
VASSDYTSDTYECGSCLAEMSGYTWNELSKDGWKTYSDGTNTGRGFILCDECDREYAVRRELAKLPAAI